VCAPLIVSFSLQVLLSLWTGIVAGICYSFFSSIYRGPGFVKLKWVCSDKQSQQPRPLAVFTPLTFHYGLQNLPIDAGD
jgi:hypothetical protein